MKKDERIKFIKTTEKLVSPEKIAKLFGNAELLMKLPKSWQKYFMEQGAKKEPYISFIVEPYSFFLAYEMLDEDKFSKMLPPGYELVDISMFSGTKERKCVIISAFNVHTSVFWGTRVELYIIAKNQKTGLVSWIIYDYETNTISYDPGRGFVEPTTRHSVLTTTFEGELVLDVVGKNCKNCIELNANIKKGEYKKFNRKLWIEGNLSVDYGSDLSNVNTKPFGLIFDPEEMNEGLSISNNDVEIIKNTFFKGLIKSNPFEVCCFPYAQHFFTSSIPIDHSIKNETDLENEIIKINQKDNFNNLPAEALKECKPCCGFSYGYACKKFRHTE